MLIRRIDHTREFFLWLLVWALTFSNALTEICMGFLVGLFVIKRLLLRKYRFPETGLNLLIYLFWLVVFISFLKSAYFKESLRGLIRTVKYCLVFFSIVDVLQGNKKSLDRLFWIVIAISAFTFSNGLFQRFFGFDLLRHKEMIPFDYLRRLNASFIHPNDFAAFIISVLPLSFCLFFPIPKRKKAALFITGALGFYCLLKTSSRGAWLGFLVGAMVYFFFYRKRISLLVPLVVVLFIALSPHGLQRLISTFSLERNTVWERTELWKGTWDMVKVHPLAGFGINTFSKYFPRYKPQDYPDVRYTHNSYLQMWSELGLSGLLVFLGIIAKVILTVSRNLKKKVATGFQGFTLLGLLSGYIAFLLQSGVDTNLYSLVLLSHFWFINAYLLALNSRIEAEIKG